MARTLALIAPGWPNLHRVSCSSEMVPNAPKQKETHQKMSLGKNGEDMERSLRKILTRRRCTNFCINCTSWRVLHQVSCSSKTVPKCTRTERNAPKHEFRVQWCGSGAFVAKNSNKTSWHELLHYLYQFGAFCSKLFAIAKRF